MRWDDGFQNSTFNNLSDVGGTETISAASFNDVGAVTVNGSTSPATLNCSGDASLLGASPVFGGSFSGQLNITDGTQGRGTLSGSASVFGPSSCVFYAIDSTTIGLIPQDATCVEPQQILGRP